MYCFFFWGGGGGGVFIFNLQNVPFCSVLGLLFFGFSPLELGIVTNLSVELT